MIKTEYENPLLKDCHKYPDSIYMFKKAKGNPILNGKHAKDLMDLRFKDVQLIKDTLQQPNEKDMFRIIKKVFDFDDFENIRLLEFYKAYNYIAEQIKIIYDSEKRLISEPSERLMAAGIEKMAIFGALNILDDIGKRYGYKPQKVEKWSYAWVFSLSLKMKYESDIQKNLENAK